LSGFAGNPVIERLKSKAGRSSGLTFHPGDSMTVSAVWYSGQFLTSLIRPSFPSFLVVAVARPRVSISPHSGAAPSGFSFDSFLGIFFVPIYAYKCTSCGHEQDVLQKMSDPRLTVCPECGQNTYAKQVTAAGFQLKGTGWYVTDFRNNGSSGASGSTSTSSHSHTHATHSAASDATAPVAKAAEPKTGGATATASPSAPSSSSAH